MKKSSFLAISLLLIMSMATAQEFSLDEILAKHSKALGYENLQKVSTVTMTGTLIQADAMPVKITRMRPDKFVMEFDIQDITAWQAYDGKIAWFTAPYTGNPKPQIMPEDRTKEMKTRADFEGVLMNWKAKGHTVELVGKDTVENSPAYKLKITKNDGGVEFLFIDEGSFLISKRLYNRISRGKEVPMENYFRDYRAVQGIMFSFTQDTHFGGQPYNSLQLDSIELNNPVDEKIFQMP
ncbi:MAG: hypothetical protein NT004_02440 [Bacteroidetes bacterium]|nr:hypothetical protein [Bacteroidota bacterium]